MTGFNLDQDVFWRSAQANQARSQQMQDLFSNLASAYTRKQELKGAKEFELEKLAKAAEYEKEQKALDPERQVLGIIQKAQAGQATPEELGVLKAWDTVESRKLGVHPITGEPYRVNASIMDTLTGAAPQPAAMPVNTVDLLAGGGPAAPRAMPVPPMSAEAITVPDKGNMGALFEGAVKPVAAQPSYSLPPAPNKKGEIERYGAELDIAKARAMEAGKAAAEVEKKKMEREVKADDTLVAVDDLLSLNKKTQSGAYQNLKSPFRKMTGFGKEEQTAIDLMAQRRLELASPLAKELGVNPTDKDFQASLDRIFDLSSTQESREAQIKQLRRSILQRRGQNVGDISNDLGLDGNQYQTTPSGIKYKVVE